MIDVGDKAHLLEAVALFPLSACSVRGVRRLAIIGSLTTAKPDPKDADVPSKDSRLVAL